MKTVTNFEKITITVDEQELLDNYRVLDKRGKHEVQLTTYLHLERVRNEYFASQKKQQTDRAKQDSNIIRFRTSTV